MDQSSLDSYFIEYYLSNHLDDPVSDQGVKHAQAELKTEMSIMIDDDCRLLSVALGVMLNSSSMIMTNMLTFTWILLVKNVLTNLNYIF